MILTLIRSIYDPEAALPEDIDFYKHALEEIEHFSIASQICHLLRERGQLDKTPLFSGTAELSYPLYDLPAWLAASFVFTEVCSGHYSGSRPAW